MKNLILFLLIFIPSILICQNEYKITTESVTWQGFSSTDAVVTAFITITNTGSTDNWYENFNGFSLRKKSSDENYKIVDIRKMLEDNSSPGSSVVSASLSFLVPITADSLMLKYPERYGGKEIFLARSFEITKRKSKTEDYSEPYVSDNDITRTTGKEPSSDRGYHPSSKGEYKAEPETAIFLIPTMGGGGILKTDKGNKNEYFWQIGYKIPIKIITFKKQNINLFTDIEFGLMAISFVRGNRSNNFLNFYGLDKSTLKAENDSGSYNPIYNLNIYGGFAIEYDKNPIIAPYLSFKVGYNWVNDSYVRIYPISSGPGNHISREEDLSGPGFQFQLGFTFFKKVCLFYNFYTFKATNGNSILNATYTGHFINLWLGGLIY
ncbi:MAG TPA: hypothetical protein VIL99_09460 [Ignavibacteria bacterium]